MNETTVEPLIERYETISPGGLRMALCYEGDSYELVHVRDDVREAYSPEEFEEKVKQLVVEGLSDQPEQEQFRLFGEMNVVVRHFERGIIMHFPTDDFSGLAVTFDIDLDPSLDTLVDIGVNFFEELEN